MQRRVEQVAVHRRYIAEQIAAIPPEDIEISRKKDHATALVIGPTHWVEPIYKLLLDRFTDVCLQVSEDVKMSLLDGYRLLARNRRSRLGWRVLIHLDPCESVDEVLRAVHGEGEELADLVPEEYRGRHLPLAAAVAKLLDDEELDEEEAAALAAALGMSLDRVAEELAVDPAEPDGPEEGELGESQAGGPSVICTTLVGPRASRRSTSSSSG